MTRTLKIVLSTLLSCSVLCLNATDTLFLSDKIEDYDIPLNCLGIFKDASRQLDIVQLTSPDYQALFCPPEVKNPHAFDQDAIYWVRFTIAGSILKEKGWILEAADPRIKNITVYHYSKKRSFIVGQSAGLQYTFDQKPYQHKNFVFDIPNDREEYTFYIRIESNTESALLFRVRSYQFFTAYALSEYYLLGIFYGILFIMALYNLLMFFTFRERLYFYYFLYVISCILITFAEDGLGFHYIWNNFPEFNYYIINFSPLLFLISFAIYSIAFLDLQERLPSIFYTIIGVTSLTSIYFLVQIYLGYYGRNVNAYIIPFTLIYISGLVRWMQGARSAMFYSFAYTFTLIAVYINALRFNKLIEWDNIFTIYMLNFSLVIEVLLLSLAQADRFRSIKLEKEKAQQKAIEKLKELSEIKDKLNKEIEAQVELQTKSLREKNAIINSQNKNLNLANAQLKQQTLEIERMNKLLNQEKEALKTNIKELTQARVFASEVDFAEFKEIFPDDNSCFAYLSELKWQQGYRCRKCQNDKYTKGQGHFARRCTKCGHNESATAQTLFHRIHFPILKGFYLVFLVYANKGNITAAELSEILSLRHNTCWKFRKKIQEKMANPKGRKNGIEPNSGNGWSRLILD